MLLNPINKFMIQENLNLHNQLIFSYKYQHSKKKNQWWHQSLEETKITD